MELLRFIGVLSLLIFIHELGHFLMAKKSGIRILEFGFGLPPRLIGKQIGETIYSLNLLPIGGFVRLFGEEADDLKNYKEKEISIKESEKRAFYAQSKKVRLMVMIAGVVMNIILGVVIFSGLYTTMGIPTAVDKVQIIGIAPNSPASETFKLEDEILSVDAIQIKKVDQFQELVKERKGREIKFELLRNEAVIYVNAIPRINPPEEEGPLGVLVGNKIEFIHYPVWQMPFRGTWFGLQEAFSWGSDIVKGLGKILQQLVSGTLPKDIGGPFEIFYLVNEFAKVGIGALLQLVGVLSINLAVVNILPIPALDGGRMLFLLVEAITGRRVNEKFESLTHAVGLVFLLALMVLITIQDIIRRFQLPNIQSLLDKIVHL